ncbi:hypothetical protein DUNSADRAFT_12957 [Dunaliella salina]|uniref:UvrD-like helicase ATP-binding domain-containing protein n=1 Tax=Dunaliella salina TaxID=3046 RepID=A0ABQ7GAE2_DUNSA|nr:hypothetical protein DUNSADRAFT_12957 [Dunaliella salina]|eukprot:KAF5831577.1 hypothetical protein DUNSADRAFT_12957 [Dunaliella salina]
MEALCAAHQSSEPKTPVGLPQVSHTIFELGFPLLHHGVFSNLYEPFLDTISTANEERAVQDLEQIVLATAPICFSTVSSAGRSVMAQARSAAFDKKFEALKAAAKRGFDVCIVDEAGQLIEAELAIVAQGFPLVPAMVLVGDHQQLPATIMSPLARNMKYGRSLLERLYANNIVMRLLDVQHRMVPDVSRYPAAAFYNGLLADGPHVGKEDRPGLASLSKSRPYQELGSYAIVNLDRGREEKLPYSTSWDKRRLNVAITRGRLAMWVIGHLATLEASGKARPDQDGNAPPKEQVWADLIRDANMRGRVFQAEQVTAVREGLNIVAKECKRQGDLKNPAMNMFEGLPWKIAFSDRFDKRLRGLLGPEERPKVLFKILQLGKGQRPKSFVNSDGSDLVADEFRGVVHVTPVFVNKLFIIWSVAIDKAQRCQYLLIQNLLKREGLLDAVKMAQQAVRTHGATYVQKCKEIKPMPGQNIILPVEWPDHVQISWTDIPAPASSASTGKVKPTRGKDAPAAQVTNGSGSRPDATEELAPQSELIEKYYVMDSISASLLIKSDKNEELNLELKMSEDEVAATVHTGTIFVQGRSGTGKTTVLIHRLLKKQEVYDRLEYEKQQEQQQQSHREQVGGTSQEGHDAGGNGVLGNQNPQAQGQQLRQLLVTLSPMLCVTMKGKIEHSLRQRRDAMFGKPGSQEQQQKQQEQQQQEQQQGQQQLEQQQQGQEQQHAGQQHAYREDLMDDEVVEAKLGELPRALSSVPDSMCPLVLPLELLLKMLDASLPDPFKPYQLSDPLAGKTALENEGGIVEDEEEGGLDMDGMDGDEQVQEDGDADEEVAVEREGRGTRLSKAAKRRGKGADPWTYGGTLVGREVKFELFDDEYWRSFDADARKIAGSSSAVFTEIVSTLKGSTAALHNKHATGGKQWLSEEDYLGLSKARGETLSEAQRRAVLKIFIQYEAKKIERGDWDLMDVVWHIHKRIDSGGETNTKFPAAAKFQEIYVDECQDLPKATISLLRYISAPQKTARGFAFAGDSAQTITRGVTFRFKDLREQYMRDFVGSPTQQDSRKRQQTRKDPATPEMFQLKANFRTTQKVVKLASSIIRLLLHWFKNSLDELPEEQGRDEGREPKPMFIEDTTDPLHVLLTGGSSPVPPPHGPKNIPLSQPGGYQKVKGSTFGNQHSSREEEQHVQAAFLSSEGGHFGAEQAVIVRDDVEKRKLKASLEQYGLAAKGLLVLTVHECKGLEFQVLPYFRSHSSPEDWWRKAKNLFDHQKYEDAKSSFELAGDVFNAQRSEAMMHRMEARKAKGKMPRHSKEASMRATQIFLALVLKDQAANEMMFHGDFKQAAELWLKLEKWQKAVDCFLRVRPVPWPKVAITRERMGEMRGALNACLKGIQPMSSTSSSNQARPESAATATRKMADLGLSLIQKRMEDTRPQYQQLDPDEAGRLKTQFLERVVRTIFVHSGTDKDLGPLVVHYVRQFASIDAQRAFLQKNEMLGALLVLEEETGDWGRAADLKEKLGDMRGAAVSYFRAGNRVHALRLLLRLLRIELMWSKDQQGHKGTGWPFVNLRAAEVESLIVQVDEQVAALQQSQPQQQEQQSVEPSDHSKEGLLAVEAEVLKAGRAWCSFHLGSSKHRTRSANVPTLSTFRALDSSLDQAGRAAGMALDSISANSEEKIYANYLRLQLLRMGWEEGARECSMEWALPSSGRIQTPLLHHNTWSYEALGKLMLLKDVLPYDFVPSEMLNFPDKRFNQVSPWQLGIMSMRDMQAVLVAMTTTQSQNVSPGKVLRIASFAAFHGLRFASRAGNLPGRLVSLLRMHSLDKMLQPTGRLAEYRASFLSPFTFITLMERNATMCMAMASELSNLVLPASYAVVHASLDGPSKLLTALLKVGYIAEAGRVQHQEALLEAGKVLSDVCRGDWIEPWMKATTPMVAEDKTMLDVLVKAFRTRAFVLWMVIMVNARKDLLARSREGTTLEDVTDTLVAVLNRAPLPQKLRAYIIKASLPQGIQPRTQPSDDLHSILLSLNDELVLLKRWTREPSPSWASKLHTYSVAQRKPVQGQVIVH